MNKEMKSIPTAALVLGVAGLAPFLGLALASVMIEGYLRTEVQFALIAYGAVILSFLGGVHWGVALAIPGELNWTRLGLSVVPPLIGWISLILSSPKAGVLLTIAFTMMLVIDLRIVSYGVFPKWYGRLRWPLTVIAALCVLGGSR